ncbi:MAG TPA: YciI family protein [Gemmatimonadaceae bacterium]|nr:YciI family protein [Gemmatimonadaceae bacterium]
MAKYLLLLREDPAQYAHMSPDEIQAIIEKYTAWGESLRGAGKMHAGMKLTDDGGWHVRRGGSAVTTTDGPYAEAKEAVGGYLFLTVADLDEATAIARQCPGLPIGLTVEVRPVVAFSPVLNDVRAHPGDA